MKTRIRIYADTREDQSGIPSLLEASGILVIRRSLPIGDYIVSEDTIIERKTASDFLRSLFDGRLFDQASRAVEAYENLLYVIEGNPWRIARKMERERQYYSALITLAVDYNAKVIYSGGPRDSAFIIESIARRVTERREGRSSPVLKGKPRSASIRDWQVYILQAFPGVGAKTAAKIMEKFQTIERFCRASVAELSRVEGLGEKKAEEIKRILVTPFTRKNKQLERKTGTLEDYY
ncbi:MAG: helix-hairpin-helix domain-containing protein [Desulfurococcales archaeon]|nr:helix-hairpin-helix domain-containing protein [Desulfurococcales archaeon]